MCVVDGGVKGGSEGSGRTQQQQPQHAPSPPPPPPPSHTVPHLVPLGAQGAVQHRAVLCVVDVLASHLVR